MQLSWQHFVGGIGLVFAAMIAWFGALWLNLQGPNLWVFRILIFLLLAIAVVALTWWLRNRQKSKPAGEASSGAEGGAGAGVAEDILLVLREAEARVASSTQLPRGTRLSSLPVIFLVGDSAAGKTCVATQSGLEPELLSGQVYQEGSIAPTRLANLWFARKAVFVEMGGKTLGDANLWTRLLHRLAPGKLRSIFSGKPAAPRAAVVCYDSEKLAKAAGPEEITVQSRAIRARLEQISQTLGINFPVYVLFTRADRLPFFDDFFRNLSDSEVTQVLGVTLPPLPASATGVYAEQETKRLTGAFNSIFYSLAECRPGLLYRERNSEKLPGIYEFPRELQKRIAIATQFLVDLCRPSQLRTSAFLRGFYFTGIRQIEAANPLGGTMLASKTSIMPAKPFSANATSIMRADDFGKTQSQSWQTATMGGSGGESKKTTQWLFLSHIFSHVILQDRAALGASGTSLRGNVWKRALLATVGVLMIIWTFGLLFSFFGNRALERDVRSAVEAIAPIKAQPSSMASLEDLQHLEAARVQLERLNQYDHSGSPLHLHWGLYSGETLRDHLRQLYFDRFKKLLFGDVQSQLGSFLRNRPASPSNPSGDDYNSSYNNLKAFLMTTLNPEKADTPFLSQFLLNNWSGPSDSPEQNRLAQQQFGFYSDELRVDNPFPAKDDPLVKEAVGQGRHYLTAFTTANFVYQAYLTKVRQTCKCDPVNFSKKYPEAEGVVKEPKIIDRAFTREGWKAMQDLISQNDWNTDDEWVLGPGAKEALTRGVNTVDVKKAYQTDYVREWREYVKSASVVSLGGPVDASKKLEKLTGGRSPLLELLCEVSENTAGTPIEIGSAFLPVSDVVKAPCYKLVAQPDTKAYVAALNDFKQCIDRYQEDPKNPATQREESYKSCRTQQMPPVLTQARVLVKSIDNEARLDECVVNLLKLEACGKAPPLVHQPDEFCAALETLSSKYPFKFDSNVDASLDEFERFFRPGGTLSREIARGIGRGARSSLVHQAQLIQNSLYPSGSPTLQFHFTISATVPRGMKNLQLNLNGVPLKVDEGISSSKEFAWPGAGIQQAELNFGNSKSSLGPFSGPWAVFNLLGKNYTWSTAKGGAFQLESSSFTGSDGSAFRNIFDLRTAGVPVPLFRRGYLSQLRCSAQTRLP